jgi:hypothetical protein
MLEGLLKNVTFKTDGNLKLSRDLPIITIARYLTPNIPSRVISFFL